MRKKRLFFLWLSLLLCAVGARAQEQELTVYEGTANSNVIPAFIYYFDTFTRSQFVIPATDLGDMGNGASISKMKFYTTASNVPYTTDCEVDVYLMEVGYTSISAFESKSSDKIVYQGTLSITATDEGGELTITFSTPYTYEGGNLLVGIENTTDGSYNNIKFLGQSVSGASVGGYSGSSLDAVNATQRNFIPQTTLYYTGGEAPSCARPKALTATDVTAESATISWTSDANEWDLMVNGELIENVTNPYTLPVELATNYSVQVRANCGGGSYSDWTNAITFTSPLCAEEDQCLITFELTDSYGDGWNGNAIKVVDQETGKVLGSFTISNGASASYTLAVCPGRTLSFQWVLGSYASECSFVIKDVNEEEIASGTATSSWATGYEIATYLVDCTEATCKMPTDLTVSNVEARSAIVSWTSEADAFELRYMAEGDDDYTVVESAITETTYTLDNLTPETTYAVSVRAVCSPADQSKWTSDATFTTPESCKTPTGWNSAYIATDAHQLSIGWNVGDTNQDTWEVAYIDEADIAGATPDDTWTFETVSTRYFTATGLQPSTRYYFAVRAICGDETSKWLGPSYLETEALTPYDLVVKGTTYQSANVAWKGYSCAYDVRYTKLEDFNEPNLLRYDNDLYASGIGSSNGGTWTWGVMYPGKMINGTQLTQIAILETSYNTGDFTVNIYSGGDDAPGTLMGTQTVTPSGENGWHTVTLETPIAINKGENLWITLTETGTYVMNVCSNTEPNNQWVYYSGEWYNIGALSSSLADYGWMIRANIVPQEGATTTWIAETTTSETAYALSGLDPETDYVVQVRANCEADGEQSDWETINFTTLTETAPVTDVVAENITSTTADIDWTVNGAEQEWNVRYRKSGIEGTITWDFEDGQGDWTTIDADGDGYTWESHINTGTGNFSAHGGNGIMTSASYDNSEYTALTPDNWLVSPQVELGGSLTFWVSAQDADYYAEHFAVYVSTRGNEAVADFREVLAETEATGEYVMYNIDLSDYSGQGYIAFRHFNCTDMFYLNIDDITLIPAGATEEPWTEVNGVTEIPVTIEGLTQGTEYEVQVQSVYNDDFTSEWTASTLFTTSTALIVLDNDYDQPEGQKNTDLLAENMGKTVDFTIQGRTLYKDGSWNTIILPFNMTKEQFDASPLAGATINYVYYTSTVVGTHVNLEFKEFDQELLEAVGFIAGYPFFVKWESGENIVDPTFPGVVIRGSEDPFNLLNEDNTIFSIGQYSSLMMLPPEELTGDDDVLIYYLTSDNKLMYTGKRRLLNAFRHAFVFRNPDGSSMDAADLTFDLSFDDGSQTTGITEVDGGRSKADAPEGYYNLQGMKLNGTPKQKGVYVTKGKKFTVK